MLLLAPPPADMLPPAGHRAGPGRAHMGPIRCSGPPGGRPCLLPRALLRWLVCSLLQPPRPGLPHKVVQTPPPPPPPLPKPSSRPSAGAWDREAGLALAGKSVREKSRPGVSRARRSRSREGPACPGLRAAPHLGMLGAPWPSARAGTAHLPFVHSAGGLGVPAVARWAWHT